MEQVAQGINFNGIDFFLPEFSSFQHQNFFIQLLHPI